MARRWKFGIMERDLTRSIWVDRIAAYVGLLKRYWEPNGVPFLDVFEKYDPEA